MRPRQFPQAPRTPMIRPVHLVLIAGVMALASVSAAAEVHVLARGDLRIEIEVNSDRLFESFGPRFDRTAVGRSVTVDGVEFLGPWGLPDEFGLYGDGVLGYKQAAVGEHFLKIGAGRLIRDTEAGYHFAHPYPVDRVFPVEVTAGDGVLTVVQQSEGDGPWQYRYAKSYQLNGANGLEIHYELSNSGSLAWTFEHYNHHWFRVADVPVGPGYRVVTGFELPLAQTGLQLGPFSLEIPGPLAPGEAYYYASELAEVPAHANHFELQVSDEAAVSYRGEFPPRRFAVYADANGFCPEVFFRAALEPGETARWFGTYRFDRMETQTGDH